MAPPAGGGGGGSGAPRQQVFGQTMHRKKKGRGAGRSNYQRQFGGGGGGGKTSYQSNPATVYRSGDGNIQQGDNKTKSESAAEHRRQKLETAKQVEAEFGVQKFVLADHQQTAERRGWLYNLVPTTVRFFLVYIIVLLVLGSLKVGPYSF